MAGSTEIINFQSYGNFLFTYITLYFRHITLWHKLVNQFYIHKYKPERKRNLSDKLNTLLEFFTSCIGWKRKLIILEETHLDLVAVHFMIITFTVCHASFLSLYCDWLQNFYTPPVYFSCYSIRCSTYLLPNGKRLHG